MQVRFFKNFFNKIERRWAKTNSRRFNNWLRKKGCKIGEGVSWFGLRNITVDVTRPSLIEIGDNVCFTDGCTILTHGYDWFVLKNLYNEIIASSGKISIGNNIFIGIDSVILKGVTIGDNCIIGVRSVVTKDIPSNSVALGSPCKVICSIDEYYRKRKRLYIEEAKSYARSIKENWKRDPVPSDFWEEFPLFMKAGESLPGVPARKQLGASYRCYCQNHQPKYDSFEYFLRDAGL